MIVCSQAGMDQGSPLSGNTTGTIRFADYIDPSESIWEALCRQKVSVLSAALKHRPRLRSLDNLPSKNLNSQGRLLCKTLPLSLAC